MSRPKVVVPADYPVMIVGSLHLERLTGSADLTTHSDFPDRDEQIRRVVDAELMITSRGALKWSTELLEQCHRLQMITTCSIGVDSIDLEAARRLGIVVSNVPGRTKTVVAEHALALLLGVARRLAFTTATMKAGEFITPDNFVMHGKMLGVIGAGSIGCEMIRLGKAIGMSVQAWTFNASEQRSRELEVPFVDLDTLLATSDAISIHVKLTDDSRGLIGQRELGLMKPNCLLVNTARGPVVDTAALIAALNSGHLGGVGQDVFDAEPLPPNDPLLSCEHAVFTPHTADQNDEGRDLLNSGAVDNVLAFIAGRPQNVVS